MVNSIALLGLSLFIVAWVYEKSLNAIDPSYRNSDVGQELDDDALVRVSIHTLWVVGITLKIGVTLTTPTEVGGFILLGGMSVIGVDMIASSFFHGARTRLTSVVTEAKRAAETESPGNADAE